MPAVCEDPQSLISNVLSPDDRIHLRAIQTSFAAPAEPSHIVLAAPDPTARTDRRLTLPISGTQDQGIMCVIPEGYLPPKLALRKIYRFKQRLSYLLVERGFHKNGSALTPSLRI